MEGANDFCASVKTPTKNKEGTQYLCSSGHLALPAASQWQQPPGKTFMLAACAALF